MPPLQGLTLLFPLLICFFMESFCICDRTTWTKVGWEIFPEEMPYLKVHLPPSHCLPYPLDKLCCNLGNLDTLYSCLHLIYISLEALVLILTVLSVHYLWTKWKKHKKQLETRDVLASSNKDPENQTIYDVDQILCKLVATTSLMTKYLNHVFKDRPAKKGKYHKVRVKKIKDKKDKEDKEPEEPGVSMCKCSTNQYEDYARNVLTELM